MSKAHTAIEDLKFFSDCDLSLMERYDMSEPSPRFRSIFFELYESLPRQGPGNRACAARAIALCRDLPPMPQVLDLGRGVGGQTLHLADLMFCSIVALDNHAPSIERLAGTVARLGLAERIKPMVGDMAEPGLPLASFDPVWSEGALYNIGIEKALRVCSRLLRPGGYLAFTETVWQRDNPPPEIKASFEADYPTMGQVRTVTPMSSLWRAGSDRSLGR